MERQRIIVLGAGGHGAEIHAYIRDLMDAGWNGELLGFLDDFVAKGEHGYVRVIGRIAEFAGCSPEFFRDLYYIAAVGDNPTRHKLVATIQSIYGDRLRPWRLIHPRASVGEEVEIGEGACLAPGVLVTCRSRIGKHAILNVKSSVSHDCVIGDYVNLNPSVTICGSVSIGEAAYIGAGATVIDHVAIGAGTVVGAGAVVTADLPANVTAVGVPARVIKKNKDL